MNDTSHRTDSPFADLSFGDVTDMYFACAETVGKHDPFTDALALEIADRIMRYRWAWHKADPAARPLPPIPPPPDDVPPPPPPCQED